jgi:hypothetical protein
VESFSMCAPLATSAVKMMSFCSIPNLRFSELHCCFCPSTRYKLLLLILICRWWMYINLWAVWLIN